jgi:serine/threonine protein phosphatase PrpC
MTDGAHCAEIALSSFLFRLIRDIKGTASEAARVAAMAANAEVYRRYRERGGTTLVAIVIFQASAAAVSIGDSRIYAVSPQKDLKQISTDDTIAGELNKMTGLNRSRPDWDPFATQLAQFVGIGEEMEPRIYPIRTDGSYLLTSDGIHGVNGNTLEQIVAHGGTPQLIVSRLLSVAKWCGGRDNATAIYVSPIHKDSFTPPLWNNSEWLEVWDSGGKMELPINGYAVELPKQVELEKRTESSESKPSTRSRKRSTGASRKKGDSAAARVAHTSTQGNLKIEIVDEVPKAVNVNSGTVEPTDLTKKATQSVDDQGGNEG